MRMSYRSPRYLIEQQKYKICKTKNELNVFYMNNSVSPLNYGRYSMCLVCSLEGMFALLVTGVVVINEILAIPTPFQHLQETSHRLNDRINRKVLGNVLEALDIL